MNANEKANLHFIDNEQGGSLRSNLSTDEKLSFRPVSVHSFTDLKKTGTGTKRTVANLLCMCGIPHNDAGFVDSQTFTFFIFVVVL